MPMLREVRSNMWVALVWLLGACEQSYVVTLQTPLIAIKISLRELDN